MNNHCSNLRAFSLVVLALLLPAPAARAQEAQNQARGFYPDLSYQLGELDSVNLLNGNMTLTIPLGGRYPVGGTLSYGLTLLYNGNVWEQEEYCDVSNCYLYAVPRRSDNAGMGWRLSLGRIFNDLGQITYEAPDGSRHALYPTLHYGTSTTTPLWNYTRNSTYLRFKQTATASLSGTLEFPDGNKHTFDTQGRLTRMEDRFGNWVNVSYLTAPTRWVLADVHGRSHTVTFVSRVYYGQVVSSVAVAAFNGTTATFSFAYTDQQLARGCDTGPDGYLLPVSETVPLLTSLTLPDTSTFSMPVADYHTSTPIGVGSCSSQSGHLLGMTLPTRGKVEWSWQTYRFPAESSSRPPLTTSIGLASRRLKDAAGTLLGEWLYQTDLTSTLNPSFPRRELKNTVIDPYLDKSVHYFSVYGGVAPGQTPPPGGWDKDEYGLPFTREQTDGAGRFLSTEVFDCDSAGNNCVIKRKTYVLYEGEGVVDGNRRLLSTRTVFADDGNRYADATFSSYDGLGHFRTVTTGGNFGAGDVRTVFTNFNPGSTATGTPTTTAPWVLNTFTETTQTEGVVTAKQEYCFDANTGFLLRERIYKTGTARGAADLVAVYTASTAAAPWDKGNVARQQHYGGDLQTLGTAALCSLALPASDVYRMDHTYRYGTLATSQYIDAAGTALTFKSVDRDIDLNTGLVKTARDEAGGSISFEYDNLDRLTYEKPATGTDGWIQYTHSKATASAKAKLSILDRTNGGATILAERQVQFDDLGRPWRRGERTAAGTWSYQDTLYSPHGWVTWVSTAHTGTPSTWTKYQNFDPFGRPTQVRPPDSSPANPTHDVTFAYYGGRQIVRNTSIGTSRNASTGAIVEATSTTTYTYDRQGRLWKVGEPSGAGGGVVTMIYSYDVGGRLAQQTMPTGTQSRSFTYDNRGFLTSETHPEKGASGNGSVTYSRYDAGGNLGRQVDGPFSIDFIYDRAERPTQVKETGAAGRVLKTFTYATANSGTNLRKGKLEKAERYHYVTLGTTPYTVLVRETYTYAGRGGRVSARTTENLINGAVSDTFSQSWVYNDLGDVSSLTYPNVCSTCGAYSPRTVTFTYTQGWLTAIPGYATSISYHASGLINQVAHANGVTWTQAADSNGIPRPASFATTGALSNWSTGTYSYDGAGDVVKVGTSWFLYDLVGRLTTGTVFDGLTGGGTQRQQSYTYDTFGNIGAITTTVGAGTPVTRNTPTSGSTNRLTGSVAYDAAGNLTSWNGNGYQYDAFGLTSRVTTGTQEWLHFYTADDERLWSYQVTGGVKNRWTLRDLDGQVLREYSYDRGTFVWRVERDLIYRDGTLLAADTPTGRVHYHPDHLGTPRLITDAAKAKLAYHVYYPFGEEATAGNQDSERMKFTGHERDLHDLAGIGDDLDYMHARYHNAQTGRFLSTDPVGGNPNVPQSWNRYAYVLGNPMQYVDPDGAAPTKAIVYFVKTVSGAYKAVKRSTALRKAARGAHAVKVEGKGASKAAKKLAKEASPGERIVRHEPHRPGDLPHYQPSTGGRGHVGYVVRDVASGLTVAHYVAGHGKFLEFVGLVADFFNPLSLGQDMVDIYDVFFASEDTGYLIEEVEVRAYTGYDPIYGSTYQAFQYQLDAYGFHTGDFISIYDLFNAGVVCIEGVCAY